MTIPKTNPGISWALSVNGTSLMAHTYVLPLKALVPIIHCISNIEDKADKPISSYFSGFIDSFRLVVSAFIYLTTSGRKWIISVSMTQPWQNCSCGVMQLEQTLFFPFDDTKNVINSHDKDSADLFAHTSLAGLRVMEVDRAWKALFFPRQT